MPEQKEREQPLDERPPVFSSWNHWYGLVLLNLAMLVGLFYWFTRLYSSP